MPAMISLWNETQAQQMKSELQLRAYSSRLLGENTDLVLHGGGNTSLKVSEKNIFGENIEVLYIKGSGHDLRTIGPEGFAPCDLATCRRLAGLAELSDSEMVRELKASMLDPGAPGPSIETLVHGSIPFRYVDHTHADAVVTLSNTPQGRGLLQELYGERVLILPFVKPGFVLAQQIYQATRDVRWEGLEAIILEHHGVFTFADSARESYEQMIRIVAQAQYFLDAQKISLPHQEPLPPQCLRWAQLRFEASKLAGRPLVLTLDRSPEAAGFSARDDLASFALAGPITPDHVIQTKRTPLLLGEDWSASLKTYSEEYRAYFERHRGPEHTMLDPAPRYAIAPGEGIITLGPNIKRAHIVRDIAQHTLKAMQEAQALGGWAPLEEAGIFQLEYWELEQAKLKKGGPTPPFEGKVALITGAASGIGRACAEHFLSLGACVVGLDRDPLVAELASGPQYLGLATDITDTTAVQKALQQTAQHFGGLDILVNNAGSFPPAQSIAELSDEQWQQTLQLNLNAHFSVLRECLPYLKLGIEPNVIFIASKNVPAPGPGASAYSCAKAGLTQLARVAALELAPLGIRVNTLHPNAVFDTKIWSEEVLQSRAQHYGISVAEYKSQNLLKVEITSSMVAAMVADLAGPHFRATTGAQIPLDGGNERVI